jgi:uncharacterized protein affecting Mg2+/Co2+ transport
MGKTASQSTLASVRFYRILLRQCRAINECHRSSLQGSLGSGTDRPTTPGDFLLQPTLDPRHNGTHRLYTFNIPKARWWHVLQFFQARYHVQEKTTGDTMPRMDSTSDSDDKNNHNEWSRDNWMRYIEPETLMTFVKDEQSINEAKGNTVDGQSILWCDSSTMEEAIRYSFRYAACDAIDIAVLHNRAVHAYHTIKEQMKLWKHASVRSQGPIRITAVPQCIAPLAEPGRYGYAYRILVENVSAALPATDSELSPPSVLIQKSGSASHAEDARTTAQGTNSSSSSTTVMISPGTVQLVGRSWIINTFWPPVTLRGNDDTGPIYVHAPTGGCVGQQPFLAPGSAFVYQSIAAGSVSGRMSGSLYFRNMDKTNDYSRVSGGSIVDSVGHGHFEVSVGPFSLSTTLSEFETE